MKQAGSPRKTWWTKEPGAWISLHLFFRIIFFFPSFYPGMSKFQKRRPASPRLPRSDIPPRSHYRCLYIYIYMRHFFHPSKAKTFLPYLPKKISPPSIHGQLISFSHATDDRFEAGNRKYGNDRDIHYIAQKTMPLRSIFTTNPRRLRYLRLRAVPPPPRTIQALEIQKLPRVEERVHPQTDPAGLGDHVPVHLDHPIRSAAICESPGMEAAARVPRRSADRAHRHPLRRGGARLRGAGGRTQLIQGGLVSRTELSGGLASPRDVHRREPHERG